MFLTFAHSFVEFSRNFRKTKLDAGWPESEEEQVRKFQIGRKSNEDNQVKQRRHQDLQTNVPRHRERERYSDTAQGL